MRGLVERTSRCWKKMLWKPSYFLLCVRYCSVDEIADVVVGSVCSLHGRDQRCMQKLVGKPEDRIRLGRLTMLDVD